jgi:hypothetical protein
MLVLKDLGMLSTIGKYLFRFVHCFPFSSSNANQTMNVDIGKGGFTKSTGLFLSSRNEHDWEKQFKNLLQYKAAHGDCDVPVKSENHRSLGRWISAQRKKYQMYFSKSATTESKPSNDLIQRFNRLHSIGFNFCIGSGNSKRRNEPSHDEHSEGDPMKTASVQK